MSVWYAWSAGVRTTKRRAVAAAEARIEECRPLVGGLQSLR